MTRSASVVHVVTSIAATVCTGWPTLTRLNLYRPAAAISRPIAHSSPADSQRVRLAAIIGTTSIGADNASIINPASNALAPSTPINRSGSSTINTM